MSRAGKTMAETSGEMANNVGDESLVNSDHLPQSPPLKKSPEFVETHSRVLDGKTMEEKIAFYAQRERQLIQRLNQNEENFGQKRAKFMEMYLQVGLMRGGREMK